MTIESEVSAETKAVIEDAAQESAIILKGQRRVSELKGRLRELSEIKSRLRGTVGTDVANRAEDSDMDII
ncbi:hypothetical protein YA0783_24935 [Pseudomonas corrugata]|uniref:hypothetical protein n=1 Tax=Pseudomonas corrugata TaxID=47879 RepID=UPI0018E5D159|nr:hypothetical protein [Pseudomonas corrugata]MBI6621538.1 hypothetical protein [Pseudomonas corrugata]MBI6694227.1 hypothetical protein [Pseudomonas corrugata]